VLITSIPEDSHLHTHTRENLKSLIALIMEAVRVGVRCTQVPSTYSDSHLQDCFTVARVSRPLVVTAVHTDYVVQLLNV
jgi:hypothetical protein